MTASIFPPLLFTTDEARALFLGAQMLVAHTSGDTAAAADRVLAKIGVILPDPLIRDFIAMIDESSIVMSHYHLASSFDSLSSVSSG